MTNPSDNTIFISRAGADKETAVRIAALLRHLGYETTLQDEDFGHASFIAMMQRALASGARIVGILSEHYLASEYCEAEWGAAITGDPLNLKGRLILFRVSECKPDGLLKPIRYTDLIDVLGDSAALAAKVSAAVGPSKRKGTAKSKGPLIDREVNWQVPSFTGREDALADLRNALFNQTGVAAVTQPAAVYGMGGVGKSAVAKEYAWQHRDAYSILWWLNAEKEDGIVDGLIRLGTRFIPDLDKEQDRTKAAKAALAEVFSTLDKPALLVFDNLEDRSLLWKWKPLEHCHGLVTSRLHGWGGDIAKVEISKWPPDDARDYLLKESGRADLKPEDAAKIAKALDYLPLALAHTAAILRDNPATTAEFYLTRIEQHMDRAPKGAEYPKAVYATYQEALAQAEVRALGAAAILCLAAFYAPDDIPFELFEQNAEVYPDDLAPVFESGARATSLRAAVSDPDVREQALSALASLSLITLKNEARTFSVHRLVQAACRGLVTNANTEWVSAAIVTTNWAFPDPEFANWPLCSRLTPHTEAAIMLAPDAVGKPLALLLNQAGAYLHGRAEYVRAEPLLRRSLAIYEKTLGRDHPHVAATLNNLAGLLQETSRLAEAEPLYRRALVINEESYGSDHSTVAIGLNNLADLLRSTNRLAEAERLYSRALVIGEKVYGPDHPDVATILNNLALLLSETSRHVESEPLLRRSLAISENSLGPDHPDVAIRLNNLAVLLHDTGRLEAVPMMKCAVRIFCAALGDDHPRTKTSMAALERMRRELEESGEKASPKGKRKR